MQFSLLCDLLFFRTILGTTFLNCFYELLLFTASKEPLKIGSCDEILSREAQQDDCSVDIIGLKFCRVVDF